MGAVVLGVDIGTSSSKGVLVDLDGVVVASAVREHEVARPRAGWVEMDAALWWDEFVSLARELGSLPGVAVAAIGVSGMGPCVLVTDHAGAPLRPAILYGIDSRATSQIAALASELGGDEVLARCGSALSTQAVGPKLRWIAENEPQVFAAARRLFMPNSWLAWQLTGEYLLDHHSASQSVPLYDLDAEAWYGPWAERVAPGIDLPRLAWPEDVAGTLTPVAAETTGLTAGIPVVLGTIDAWTEAVSVGATSPGDLMLMYGTTMFLVCTVANRITVPALWATAGAFPGTRSLAGGMATSGAITGWLRELYGRPDFATLLAEAEDSGVGASGLVMLPYFAGERTPIADPDARGVIAGLTVSHTRGDLYRAALEGTGFGVRHNIETFAEAGIGVQRIVAVGGGTQGSLWLQVLSDILGLRQEVPTVTIGASYGAAFLAARVLAPVDIRAWNPVRSIIEPRTEFRADYEELWSLYRSLYPATQSIVHALAARQKEA